MLVLLAILMCLSLAVSAPTDPRLVSSYVMVDTPWYHYQVYAPAFMGMEPLYLPEPDDYMYSSVQKTHLGIPEHNFDSLYYSKPKVPLEVTRTQFPSNSYNPPPTFIICSPAPDIRDELPPQTISQHQPLFGLHPKSPPYETQSLTSTNPSLFSPNVIREESAGETGFGNVSKDRLYTPSSTPRPGYITLPQTFTPASFPSSLPSLTPNIVLTPGVQHTPPYPSPLPVLDPTDSSSPLFNTPVVPREYSTVHEFPQTDDETRPGVTDSSLSTQRLAPPVLYEAPGHAVPQRR